MAMKNALPSMTQAGSIRPVMARPMRRASGCAVRRAHFAARLRAGRVVVAARFTAARPRPMNRASPPTRPLRRARRLRACAPVFAARVFAARAGAVFRRGAAFAPDFAVGFAAFPPERAVFPARRGDALPPCRACVRAVVAMMAIS
jgi:hypothetical protein